MRSKQNAQPFEFYRGWFDKFTCVVIFFNLKEYKKGTNDIYLHMAVPSMRWQTKDIGRMDGQWCLANASMLSLLGSLRGQNGSISYHSHFCLILDHHIQISSSSHHIKSLRPSDASMCQSTGSPWLGTCLVPSHYINQCWLIVNWTTRNNSQFHLNKFTKAF